MRHGIWTLVVMVLSVAHAQDAQRFKPAPGTTNHFSVDRAETLGPYDIVPSLYLNYGHRPLVERGDSEHVERALVGHLTSLNALAVIGVYEQIEVGVDLPLHLVLGDADEGAALGDIRVLPKVLLVREGKTAVAIAVPISLPTGDSDLFVGEGQVTLNPKLVLQVDAAPVHFTVNGGFLYRPDPVVEGALEVGHEVSYGVGVNVDFTDEIQSIAEVYGSAPATDTGGRSRDAPLEAIVGGRWFLGGPVLTAGIGAGLVPDYGTPAVRLLVGLAWVLDKPEPEPEPEPEKKPEPEEKKPEPAAPPPPPDSDGDGIADDVDKCVDKAEDVDKFQDEDGCPDLDNDGDWIPDVDDKCPLKKEVVNGVDDEDGCPDEGLVVIEAERLRILEKVHFATNKAVIKRESFGLLDQVAAVLKSNPQILHVRIEGHTDGVGQSKYNQELSQRRADAVRDRLVGGGVEKKRLSAVGYGESKPLDTNGNEEGRAANRRVEFTIVEQREAAGTSEKE